MFALVLLFAYFVSFTDKPGNSSPQLSERAVQQRQKWGIETDQADYPVSPLYMDSLRRMGVTIYHCSRWFNGVTCEMDEATAAQVETLSFVSGVEMTRNTASPRADIARRAIQTSETRPYTEDQLALFNLTALHNAGYEGQGIVIAVCDGGFYHADTLSCIRKEQQLGHFDFTDDTDGFYGSTGRHGTECLSTITGFKIGYYGAATLADYYLMRSEENNTESPKEMDNLVAALEKADSLGVNIFSVSLGYYLFTNGHWDLDKDTELDGKTTRASLAATIAARKGMLVCVAAGNEGNKPWKTICSPADADSILTVGAVGRDSISGSFSSLGPSSDGRVKPDVCAMGVGTALLNENGLIEHSNGTSYATPLIAGLAACLWSALPDENAMQIRERIIRSAHLYPGHDANNQMGYGIPDAWKAYTMPSPAESVEHVKADEAELPRKILRGEQVLIIRYGHIYNLAGQRVQ